MKFIEKLFSKDTSRSIHPTVTQQEREAIIDLMLLATYVDNHLSFAESKEFDDAADSLGWESNSGISVYISNATSRARNARGSEAATAEFIEFAEERLTSVGSKERALELLNRLFMSDGKTDTEKAFFDQVEASLKA